VARMIPIRTVDMYWKDFVIHGIDAKWGAEKIKKKLLDAFRQEILQQVMLRTGYDNIQEIPQEKQFEDISKSVLAQTQKRWDSLVKRCRKYKETADIISEKDLMEMDLNAQENA